MKKTILIIDDQQSTRLLLSYYLGNYYNVIERPGAREALDLLDKGVRPDAIISDILMPEMTGIDFLKVYQQKGIQKLPVIMLSSVENSSEKLKCFQFGARDYMMKPFNPEELRARLSNALSN
jgi:two-component system chemotaxis response regulator CheY